MTLLLLLVALTSPQPRRCIPLPHPSPRWRMEPLISTWGHNLLFFHVRLARLLTYDYPPHLAQRLKGPPFPVPRSISATQDTTILQQALAGRRLDTGGWISCGTIHRENLKYYTPACVFSAFHRIHPESLPTRPPDILPASARCRQLPE